MTFYSELAATALELLAEFGVSGVLRRASAGTFDANAGTVTGSSDTDYTITATLFDYSLKDSGASLADGTVIQAGDKQIYAAASGLDVTPLTTDTLIINSITYKIVNVKSVAPSGVAVIYELCGRV
jgi:hypothetical protein